eukprot:378477-Pyramimonas_sp.AAC.1
MWTGLTTRGRSERGTAVLAPDVKSYARAVRKRASRVPAIPHLGLDLLAAARGEQHADHAQRVPLGREVQRRLPRLRTVTRGRQPPRARARVRESKSVCAKVSPCAR